MTLRTLAVALALSLFPGAAQSPPPVPRVGFYQWLGVMAGSDSRDLLTQARELATASGARLFRLYVGARYDYVHPVLSPRRFSQDGVTGELTPAAILTLPRFRAVLEDPLIDTVVVTVYSIADAGGGPDDINLLHPWNAADNERVAAQIGELCRVLYQEHGEREKTIILVNNEADEKLLEALNYLGSPQAALQNLSQWINARQGAVEAARAAHPEARLKILHAFEISLVNLRILREGELYRKGVPWPGEAGRESWNALENIVPSVRFDLLSYSSYETANSPYETQDTNAPPQDIEVRMKRDLDRIRERARASVSKYGRELFGDHFVMIGELGFARDQFEALPSGGVLPRLRIALRSALDWGAPFVVLWQVFDAPRNIGQAWGFGMVDRQGREPRLRAPVGACDTIRACVSQEIAER